MPFFNLHRRRSLQPSWEFVTRGIIWRLYPAGEVMLLGEERDPASKTASFFCIGAEGIPLWKEKDFGERWWMGVETIEGGVLLLHGFASPDLPEHRRITAVDCASGEVLWRNEDVRFVAAVNNAVYASRQELGGRIIALYDLHTGALVKELGREMEALDAVPLRAEGARLGDVTVPATLPTGEPGLFERLLHAAGGSSRVSGRVEFAESGGAVVFGFHERANGQNEAQPLYNARLAVVAKESGETRHQVTLDAAVPFCASGLFMIRGETLYYVRGGNTLTAVTLAGERTNHHPDENQH